MTAAGFYHCSVKSVGRAKGRSVVAAAAYRSGERLHDEITGQTFDYRARGGVIDSYIIAPENAPAWAQERERLWNEAERAETRANGRLATELELALPHELTAAQRKELIADYVRPIIERYGVAVDVAIHEPGEGRDHRNIHSHILVTHREIGADGFEELSNARTVQKQNRKPEKIYGIAANSADVVMLRKDWEQAVNRAYERAGLDIRVDHRSHKDRGIEQEPTIHLGPAAAEIERRRPGASDRGDTNRDIEQRNAERQKIAALEAEERKLSAEVIDLKAERAMREAREAATGRYDRLDDTHRQVARDQFPGRYDELTDATPGPEVTRAFDSSANRTTEPAAPVYDRDADNAAWEAKLEEAAIAKAEGRNGPRQPEDAAGRETPAEVRGPADGADKRPDDMRPLGKTAGDIREAWALSRSAEQLEDALASHGISLAVVTPEEAQQSQRTAAFAKEVGNFAPLLKEGEIVAINQHGDVHRFNQRTTGDAAPNIEAKFPGMDRAALMSVADTAEVMQEAARAAWRDQRHAEREQARSPTAIEATIADALTSTMTGTDFAAALDAAGLTITRADETDVKALDALRDDASLAAIVAHADAEPHTARHFATLQAGDLAAVNQRGDVFQISPHKFDLEDIAQRLADVQQHMPSIVEARAQNEITREATADFWAELRAANMDARIANEEARQGDRALHDTVAASERVVNDELDATGEALEAGTRAFSSGIGRLAKAVESVLSGIFSFFGAAEPKLTPMQAELAARANDELAEAREIIAEMQDNQSAKDWLIFQQDRQQQQEEMERETGYRERPGDRERERERERY